MLFFYNRRLSPLTQDTREGTLEPKSCPPAGIDQRKRQMLRAGISAAIAVPIIYLGLESLLSPQRAVQSTTSLLLSQFQQNLKNIKPKGFEDAKLAPLLDSEVTPTEMFYRIDKYALVPEVNAQTWTLNGKGLVDKPLILNYLEINSMPHGGAIR